MNTDLFCNHLLSSDIPREIIDKINKINLREKYSYAAFDLDNTLLIDDIGEAVFVELVNKKLIKNFDWNDYKQLISQNRGKAYKKMIDVMNGIKLKKLIDTTYEIINNNKGTIETCADIIPIPKPNSIMKSLVSLLKIKGVDIYVVTASNSVSAEIISWEYFGIPSSNVLGAFVGNNKGKILFNFSDQIPYAEGKVNALKKRFNQKPIITGGDSIWDKFLLDYTASDGIRLWIGKDKNEYQKLKNEYYRDLDFFYINKK